MTNSSTRSQHLGLLYAVGAYGSWGLLLPLFLKLLLGVSAVQILAHRIVWSVVFLALIVTFLGRWRVIRKAVASPRTLRMLLLSSVLIAANWLVYIWAVLHDHMLQASLGYFINPLVNVVLGVLVLGERLRRAQIAAVALAAAGVALLAWHDTSGIWISLILAGSFSCYGLVRKLAPVDALSGLLIETTALFPAALGWLLWEAAHGVGAFGMGRTGMSLLLASSGGITATPLLLFAAAAKRLRYATMGLVQYMTPTLIFLEAVWIYNEPVSSFQLITFSLIWAGCAIYAADGLYTGSLPKPMAPE